MRLLPSLRQRRKGYALATILVLMGVSLFGAGAMVTISTLESKISRSQKEGVSAYYAAEAGAQDALWKINNTTSYAEALANGTMTTPITYTMNNLPVAGQGYTVTIQTDTDKGAGYGKVTSEGYSDNGDFVARRVVEADIFCAPLPGPTGTNAIMTGGNSSITNHSTQITVNNGNIYAGGNISMNLGGSGSLNMGSGQIITSGSFSTNNAGAITSGGVVQNAPPQVPPGFDFSYYADPANNDASYSNSSNSSFQSALMSQAGLTGPVTYYNGNVTMNSWARNRTLRINGMLVINGSLTINADGLRIILTDPGNGKAGIFVNGNIQINNGELNPFDGVLYSTGNISVNAGGPLVINGGMVSGGNITLNTGLQMTLTYVASRMNASFGAGTLYATDVQHWEEEYAD